MPSSMPARALPSGTTRTLPSARRILLPALPLLAVLASLSACAQQDLPAFAPVCPQTAIRPDAGDLSQYRGAGADLTDLVVDGRITGLSGKCSLDDRTHLHTRISVKMELTRGPAAKGPLASVTYFVAVAKGDKILDKKDYTVAVTFPPNSDKLRLSGEQVDLVLPVDEHLTGAAYSILVGYQLTPQQLALNRRRGPR